MRMRLRRFELRLARASRRAVIRRSRLSMNLARSSGVQLHPTSLPGGRLGDGGVRLRGLARGRGPVVVADAAARAAGPLRLALQGASAFAAWPGLLAEPRAPVTRDEELDFRERNGVLDRRLGALRRARRGAPTRCASTASGRALRSHAADARRAADRRRADLRRARARPTSARIRELFQRRRGRRRAAGRVHRQGPAVGQPAVRLAGAAAARLPLVDRALPPHVRALRPRAHRPLPRLRRLLGGAGGRALRAGGPLEARAGAGGVRRRRARARRACR